MTKPVDMEELRELVELAKEAGLSRLKAGDIEIEISPSHFLYSASGASQAPAVSAVVPEPKQFVRPSFIKRRE